MSDNDLIKRGDVKAKKVYCYERREYVVPAAEIDWISPVPTDGDCVSRAWLLAEYNRQHEGPAGKARKLIEDAPAVPQEMTAREYERALDRAFRSDDDAYGEWADAIDEGNKDKAVAIIEKWAREHPEERSEQ